jgi:hypothetical protein
MNNSDSNDELMHNINELNKLIDEEIHWIIRLYNFIKKILKLC